MVKYEGDPEDDAVDVMRSFNVDVEALLDLVARSPLSELEQSSAGCLR